MFFRHSSLSSWWQEMLPSAGRQGAWPPPSPLVLSFSDFQLFQDWSVGLGTGFVWCYLFWVRQPWIWATVPFSLMSLCQLLVVLCRFRTTADCLRRPNSNSFSKIEFDKALGYPGEGPTFSSASGSGQICGSVVVLPILLLQASCWIVVAPLGNFPLVRAVKLDLEMPPTAMVGPFCRWLLQIVRFCTMLSLPGAWQKELTLKSCCNMPQSMLRNWTCWLPRENGFMKVEGPMAITLSPLALWYISVRI